MRNLLDICFSDNNSFFPVKAVILQSYCGLSFVRVWPINLSIYQPFVKIGNQEESIVVVISVI